ncbi:MAG: hypothetical protein K2P68_08650 [Sphingomonas sp.]|nr:hypothetical protein [Sphingomonas sp.]
MTKSIFHRQAKLLLPLVSMAMLPGCGSSSTGESIISAITSAIGVTPTPSPSPTPSPTPGSGQTSATLFQDRIVNADGTMNWSEYEYVANNYNKEEILNYRLGPSYADLNPSSAVQFPTVYQPDPNGLWKGGLNKALADQFCQTSDKLIQSDSPDGYGNGFGGGGGWIMSGQMLFAPDATAAQQGMQAGTANMRAFDGAGAARASDGSTQALCMRMNAAWTPDWWNRNGISVPEAPAVSAIQARYPNLPFPAVATARGEIQTSVTGFLAFQNGVIGAAGTGNDAYTGISNNVVPVLKLPDQKVPTALAVTANNEFLFVTVWDVAAHKGQLGVIAISGENGNIGIEDTGRYGWGNQSWPTVNGIKLLGFVDLPMAAPNTLSVTTSVGTGNPRGTDTWRGVGLDQQSVRDAYFARSNLPWDAYLPQEEEKKLLATAGYAVVGSRAENKVAIVDLRPLLTAYRDQYFTTKTKWDETANNNQGPADNKWPYGFAYRAAQRPVVVGVLNINQPTAVYARQRRGGTNTLSGWDGLSWNYLSTVLTVASMDGKVRQYDVVSLINPVASPQLPNNALREWQVGSNPVQITTPIAGAGRTDDLYIVSRGTREIGVYSYKGDRYAVLKDARLRDPVFLTIGGNQAGFGGAGKDRALSAQAMTVLDYSGKTVHVYGLFIDNYPARYQPGRLDPWVEEQWPYAGGPQDKTVQPFQYGSGRAVPGKPFMFSFDEVI